MIALALVSAVSAMEVFLIGLPPIEAPAEELTEYDLEELPAEEAAA